MRGTIRPRIAQPIALAMQRDPQPAATAVGPGGAILQAGAECPSSRRARPPRGVKLRKKGGAGR